MFISRMYALCHKIFELLCLQVEGNDIIKWAEEGKIELKKYAEILKKYVDND